MAKWGKPYPPPHKKPEKNLTPKKFPNQILNLNKFKFHSNPGACQPPPPKNKKKYPSQKRQLQPKPNKYRVLRSYDGNHLGFRGP